MTSQDPSGEMTLAQLGHHIGLHITVNLQGKTVGGVFFEAEQWVPGVVVGLGALGDSLTIKLDAPIGGGERAGLLRRESRGQDMVAVDDAGRVRAMGTTGDGSAAAADEIRALVHAGKTKDAIKRYREINGATLDEARAYIATL